MHGIRAAASFASFHGRETKQSGFFSHTSPVTSIRQGAIAAVGNAGVVAEARRVSLFCITRIAFFSIKPGGPESRRPVRPHRTGWALWSYCSGSTH